MSFFKFSKFSKFLSTCFAFSFLFSGSQTYSMEPRNRVNLGMLGIGIRNNSGDDNESAATRSTVASPLDGIEFKIPEGCKFCNRKVVRKVVTDNCRTLFICKNDNCLQSCCDEFLISNGWKLRKLDLNADNVPRCEYCKMNMKNLEKLKKANYKCPGMSEQICRQMCESWERYNEDKLLDVGFMPCGHSICLCGVCIDKLRQQGRNFEIVCPKCNAKFGFLPYMLRVSSPYNANSRDFGKSMQFFEEKLNGDWRDRVIGLDDDRNYDVAYFLAVMFTEGRASWNSDVAAGIYKFDENRFNRVNDVLSLGEKYLVLDGGAPISKALHFLEISKLDGYIESLIKNGEYRYIIYPVKGELHDKIEAIAIRFIKDNTITIPKKMYDEIQTGILNKMFKDDIE